MNILGFIPLGFLLYGLAERSAKFGRYRFVLVVLSGFFFSLAIEVAQAYLPTRASQITDVLTNTFGTALGAIAKEFLSRPLRWIRGLHESKEPS